MSLTGIILAGGRGSRFGFNKLKIKVDSVPLFIDQVFKLSFFCDEIIISTSKRHYPIIFSELKKISIYKKKYNFEKIQAPNPEIEFKNSLKKNKKPINIKIFPDENFYRNLYIKSSLNITNPRESRPDYGGMGPIIGIYTGLLHARYYYSLVIAFDMPFISYNLLNSLINISRLNHKKSDSNKTVSLSSSRCIRGKAAYIIKTQKGFETLCGIYSKDCLDILKKNIKRQKYKISDAFRCLNIEILPDKKHKVSGVDSLNFFNINRRRDYDKFKNIWKSKKFSLNINSSFAEVWSDFFFR